MNPGLRGLGTLDSQYWLVHLPRFRPGAEEANLIPNVTPRSSGSTGGQRGVGQNYATKMVGGLNIGSVTILSEGLTKKIIL